MWYSAGLDGEPTESQPPRMDEKSGRVVPADGDPEVERYQARLYAQRAPHFRLAWMRGGRAVARRHIVRNWALTLGALALVVLFIKPLLVFAAVAVAVVVGLVLLALLVAGALLLAMRYALGGRMAYHLGRAGRWRR